MFTVNSKEYPWLKDINYQVLEHDNTERFANKEAVWLRQNHLIGSEEDTKDIINAFDKVASAIQKDPKIFLNLDL